MQSLRVIIKKKIAFEQNFLVVLFIRFQVFPSTYVNIGVLLSKAKLCDRLPEEI